MPMPFSTTFDYPVWKQADGLTDAICSGSVDGLSGYGSWYANNDSAHGEEFTAAANYSSGGGGLGQRHWYHDTENSNSGGTLLDFGGTYSEFWFRCYVRFQSGFTWANNAHCKLFYVQPVGGVYCAPGYHSNVIGIQSSDVKDSSTSWNTVQGGSTGDGLFHCYEYHVKQDTNGSNGIAQAWIDNVEVMNITNADWGTQAGWTGIAIGENHFAAANATGPIGSPYAYIDYDDFAVSATARIGPLAGGATGASRSVIFLR